MTNWEVAKLLVLFLFLASQCYNTHRHRPSCFCANERAVIREEMNKEMNELLRMGMCKNMYKFEGLDVCMAYGIWQRTYC